MLKTACIRKIPFMDSDALQNLLLGQGAIRPMYYIGEEWAGDLINNISIKQSIENMLYEDWSPRLLYFGNEITYFEGLQHIGAPERCVLVNKNLEWKEIEQCSTRLKERRDGLDRKNDSMSMNGE